MKSSIYNSLIPLEGKYYLLYNSYSDKYIILSQKLKDLFEETSIDCLEKYNHILFQQLKEAHCIIDNSVDEQKELQAMADNIRLNYSDYHLIINPTLNCNFRCWYCYESHIPNSKITNETLIRIYNHINLVLENKRLEAFKLSFFGGEPLLYFEDIVVPIIKFLSTACKATNTKYNIYFTSNAYLLTEERIKILSKYNVNAFQITLDGSKDFHNKVRIAKMSGDSYSRIISNVIALIKNKIFVILRINYTIDNIISLGDIVEDLLVLNEEDKKLISIDFQKVWQVNMGELQDHEVLIERAIQKFLDHNFSVSHKNMDMLRNPCYADLLNEVLINYDGLVYKCTARDFNKAESIGSLEKDGNIKYNDNYIFNTQLSSECLVCRIAPLCGGGCFKRKLEQKNVHCYYNYNETMKDKIVLDKFYNDYMR